MLQSLRPALLAGLILCFTMVTLGHAQDNVIERRAAFDIGSATIKCTIADVDTATGQIVSIVEELSRKVDFAEDMARSYDENFSKEIMDKGIATLKELKTLALEKKAMAFSAVGGDNFHKARNGRAYFAAIKAETGIPSRVISKQQASLLSYHAVLQQRDSSSDGLLVWDIGGGSMEMTTRNKDRSLTFHADKMGSIPFKNVIISVVQEKNIETVSSPNPIDEAQVKRALEYAQTYALLNVPVPLAKRIGSRAMTIAGIGGVHYYSIPEVIGSRKATYTRDEVAKALAKWTGKTDKQFDSEYADTRLSNLILVLGYMDALNITAVSPMKVNQATGLLVAPEFW